MEGRLPMMKKNAGGSPTSPPLHSPTQYAYDEGSLYRKSSITSSRRSSRAHTRHSSIASISDEESLLRGPASPTKVPPLRAMRSSMDKKPPSQPPTPGGRSRSSTYGAGEKPIMFALAPPPLFHTYKATMIRGKWATARLRTILYFFVAAAAATTFGLVLAVYKMDYLPYKDAASVPRTFSAGTWAVQPPDLVTQGLRHEGMRVRAYFSDMDMKGVYLILAFCGTGMVVFFGLWLQNIYRNARSYYVLFTRVEYFSLAMLILYGIGFGATAGYVTYTFKLDNNFHDFWSYTCSRHGTAQATIFKGQIYYDGNCHMLTGAWITLLVLCGFSFLALISFPANYFYHRKMKNVGYSRFENKIGMQAELEDQDDRRRALQTREPWKFSKWGKFGKKANVVEE